MSLLSGVLSHPQAGHSVCSDFSCRNIEFLTSCVSSGYRLGVLGALRSVGVLLSAICPVNLGMWLSSCACTPGVPGLPRLPHRGPWRLRHMLAALELWNHLALSNSTPCNSKCLTSHPYRPCFNLGAPLHITVPLILLSIARGRIKQTLNRP